MRLAVGVDGGGTTVRAVVVDAHGSELARAEAPGAVVTGRDATLAADAVGVAVRSVLASVDREGPVDALCAGLAGAGDPEAREATRLALEEAGLAARVHVTTDVEVAFRSAFGEGPGLLVISGTGSIGYARSAQGITIRVGGWGRWLGDEGSGHGIGLAALRAVTRAEDGRGPTSALSATVLDRLGVARAVDLVRWIESSSKADVAGLVPVVLDAASAGDAVAESILADAMAELRALALALVERAGPWSEPPELVPWGGLIGPEGPLRERLDAALADVPVHVSPRAIDPALGAAEMAVEALREG